MMTPGPRSEPAAGTIRVGTLNLRNTSDRWPERYPLLINQLSRLSPDIIGFQELRRPSLQGHRIVKGANHGRADQGGAYRLYKQWKTGLRWFWEGLAVLTELTPLEHERIDLGSGNRIAQRLRLPVGDGQVIDFYNTHLHHAHDEHDQRTRQAERILEWMARDQPVPQVLVGDFNARPGEPSIQRILESGALQSAYVAVHGAEPELTVPTPLTSHRDDDAKVIDYIFVNHLVEIHDAWITFDDPHETDDRLAASDHFGLAATISVTTR